MPRRPLAALLALAALALAGCLEAGPSSGSSDEPGTWSVGGSLVENATSEDVRDLESRLAPLDASLVGVMESFPMQYRVEGPSEARCEEARAVLAELAYVASVGECVKAAPAGEPHAPASSG